MLNRILHLLEKTGNEQKDQRRLILTFLSIALFTLLVSTPLAIEELGKFVYFSFVGFLLIFIVLVYMNQVWLAKAIIPFVLFAMSTRFIYGGGIHHHFLGGYYLIVILEGLINGQRSLLRFGVLSTLAVIVIGVAETSGWITTRSNPLTEPITVAVTAFFLLATTLALNFLVVRLKRAADEAQKNESEQIKANEKLRELQAVLEERVDQRTSELDFSNQQLTIQFERVIGLQKKLKEEAIRDSLTTLFNRRFLDETLPIELARLLREESPMTILMVDIDHFKEINDTYGHQVGDVVLQEVGYALKSSVRAGDIVIRYGGEEFILVFPGMKAEFGRTRAEKIRVMIASLTVSAKDQLINVTISIGGAVFPENGNTSDDLIGAADLALYRAKNNGRNRVEFAEPGDHRPKINGDRFTIAD